MIKHKYLKWLDKNIQELNDKKIIVTGSNSGIGYYTAMLLSLKNAHIIMACRNIQKAETAKNNILKENPKAKIDILPLDLSSFASIHQFADLYQEKFHNFDVLIHNAGVYHLKQSLTKDGYETVMATNYLGTYLLNELMMPLHAKDSRIVFTTSIAHKWGKLDYKDFFSENKYKYTKVYANSKLALSRYFIHLSSQTHDHLKVIASHPGVTSTNLLDPNKGGVSKMFSKCGNAFLKIFTHSAIKASLSAVYAAGAIKVNNQDVYGPRGLMHIAGYPKKQKLSKKAYKNIDELMTLTNDLTLK